jgi:hypothetical protein
VRLGVGFPHQVIGTDPAAAADFARAAEDAGFDFLSAIEHVAGAHAERFAGVERRRTCTITRSTSRSRCSRSWPG